MKAVSTLLFFTFLSTHLHGQDITTAELLVKASKSWLSIRTAFKNDSRVKAIHRTLIDSKEYLTSTQTFSDGRIVLVERVAEWPDGTRTTASGFNGDYGFSVQLTNGRWVPLEIDPNCTHDQVFTLNLDWLRQSSFEGIARDINKGLYHNEQVSFWLNKPIEEVLDTKTFDVESINYEMDPMLGRVARLHISSPSITSLSGHVLLLEAHDWRVKEYRLTSSKLECSLVNTYALEDGKLSLIKSSRIDNSGGPYNLRQETVYEYLSTEGINEAKKRAFLSAYDLPEPKLPQKRLWSLLFYGGLTASILTMLVWRYSKTFGKKV